MDTLLLNARHALRRMLNNRLYTTVIVLCLALGIGANTAIFSVIDALLLSPLPVKNVSRLAFSLDMRGENDPFESSLLTYMTLKEQGKSFESAGISQRRSFNLTGGDRPERVEGAGLTVDYLPTLGVKPILGRGFTAEDCREGATPVALVGYGLWQRRFAGDTRLVGQPLRLENQVYTVVGILPPQFDLPLGTEIWVPIARDIKGLPFTTLAAHSFLLVTRIREGVSLQEANTEARALARQLEQAYPEDRKGWGIKLIPLRQQLLGDINGFIQPALYLVISIVGLLLLITCANVASLLLVRSLERSHEVAVQTALGATRPRLVAQLLTESVLLALVGGVAGVLLAAWTTPVLMSMTPVYAPALKNVFFDAGINSRVLLFAFGVSVLTGIVFGLVPATRTALPGSMLLHLRGGRRASGSKASRRLLAVLVVAEITVAVVLLFSATLMVRSFQRLSNASLGFETQNRLVMDIYLQRDKYTEPQQRRAFVQQVVEQVRQLPGVISAGTTTNVPLALASFDSSWFAEGTEVIDATEEPITANRVVSAEYLQTLGVKLVQGRLLSERDRENTPRVVVISEELARRAWPGQSPIGKRLKASFPPNPEDPWFTVVGVVRDAKEDRFNFRSDRPVWYLSYQQVAPMLPLSLMVHTRNDPEELADKVRQAVWAVDRNQAVTNVTTLDRHIAGFLGPQRFSAVLIGAFAFLGLVLAMIGLYGMLSYSVKQSVPEIGIRMALGAQAQDLLRMVLSRGLRLAIIGVATGLGLGLVVGRFVSGVLFQVDPRDPLPLVGIALALLAVALLATYVPARRTARIDPIVAL
ncbi:MAG TPA: ABC transporter permease, partial [Thermoanaerobaculia bacterium]|nr:ABC transporter permease [Thermoanaerobaculia bacterium]